MTTILDGRKVASAIREELAIRLEALKKRGVFPKLAIIRVGEKSEDIYYERSLAKQCGKLGILTESIVLGAGTGNERLLHAIAMVNQDDAIHGCMVFRPLPDEEMELEACKALHPEKDVDGMTFLSLAGVFANTRMGYPPCTAEACLEMLDRYGIPLRGKKVTVVGRSLVIGKPVSAMLQNRDATVTMCHSKTRDLVRECREADILVVAIGKAKAIDRRFVSPRQTVIDVGINVDESGKTRGDVDYDEVSPLVQAITPVPGGVGSVTTAILCRHVVEAAERKTGIEGDV